MVVYLVMSIALRRGQFKLDGIGTSAHLFGHLPCKFHLVSNLRDEADLFRDLRRIPRTSRSQDSSRKRPDLDAPESTLEPEYNLAVTDLGIAGLWC
jgi:hypothetical protein